MSFTVEAGRGRRAAVAGKICHCGCGHVFAYGDRVVSRTSHSHNHRHYYLEKCWDRLLI